MLLHNAFVFFVCDFFILNSIIYKMKFIKIVFVFLLIITVSTVWSQSFLHSEGKNIINESSNKIFLKGVGLGNWMLPEGYMWKFGMGGDRPRKIEKIISELIGVKASTDFWQSYRANYINESDISRIAELGYNSVRPALNSRLFITEGKNNEFLDEGFLLLDQLIQWCKKYNLYVIIDMHGAPGGQTGANIDDSPNDIPELFTKIKNQDLLEELWVKIARRYKDEPVVAGYDLLNEPLPEGTGAAEKYKDLLVPLYKRLIKAIRKVDQKHMLIIEGYNWANNWSLFDAPMDKNISYQFHYYCWDRPDKLKNINYFLKNQDKLNVPVWVGETGEKGNTIYFGTSQYFRENNIGWSLWPWKKMDTQNTPYSILPPKDWDKIIAYTKGGEKPAVEEAKRIFAEFKENIKLKNCIYYPDVVNAMMCRIPLKIEAENYGHNGLNISYFVNDTIFKSKNYRTEEPVPVQLLSFNKQHLSSEQSIKLKDNEWTKYNFESSENVSYTVILKLKALNGKAKIEVKLNGKPLEINVDDPNWIEQNLGRHIFIKGANELQLFVKSGKLEIDWINIY